MTHETERCAYHRVVEPTGVGAIQCPECHHVYRSPAELVDAFNRDVVDGLNHRRDRKLRPLDRVNRVGLVPFCPTCSHDLPDLSHLEGR